MENVGLSPTLKNRIDLKVALDGTLNPSQKPFEAQSSFKNRKQTTDRSLLESSLVPLMMSPIQGDDSRNKAGQNSRTTVPSDPAAIEAHKKLLHRINEEKTQRKQREDARRQKTLDRYNKEVEEK